MGTIIAAIIAAAGAVISTSLSNQATEDANREGLRLANIRRKDEMKIQEENKKLSETSLRLQKKQLQYGREAELYGRKERALERGMTTRQNKFANQIALLNRNDAMRNQLVNVWRRAA